MMEFFKKHNIVNRFFALVLAVCLWVIAMNDQNPLRPRTYHDIPLDIIGTDTLLEKQGLMVIGGEDTRVELRVSGQAEYIRKIDKAQLYATVDVSNVKTAGVHSFSYTIDLPEGVTREHMSPANVELVIDHVGTKEVPVEATLESDAPTGYRYGDPQPVQRSVTIEGPQTILDTVQFAHVVVPTADLLKTTTQSYEYKLVGSDGNEITSPYLSRSINRIDVGVHVYRTATLPLEVKVEPSQDVSEDMATVTISPASVEVYGDESVLKIVKSVTLGVIDLANVETGAERTLAIRLPAGVYLNDGQPSRATVSVQIDEIATRTIAVSDITYTDTSLAAQKPTVQTGEQTVQVTLRGKNSVLTAINAGDIKVTASYDSAALQEGENRVPVTVELPAGSEDVTILSHTETVAVTMTKTPSATPETPTSPTPEHNTDTTQEGGT